MLGFRSKSSVKRFKHTKVTDRIEAIYSIKDLTALFRKDGIEIPEGAELDFVYRSYNDDTVLFRYVCPGDTGML